MIYVLALHVLADCARTPPQEGRRGSADLAHPSNKKADHHCQRKAPVALWHHGPQHKSFHSSDSLVNLARATISTTIEPMARMPASI
mmetsp:Transcript_66317/g.181880  ORF Transcript_66317/g.181880 Transcript_66317/m.181880 type:complete len:87 (-) Transcript_66317:198-458(-)|eukprot:5295550-Prymnesium_polylepis.3